MQKLGLYDRFMFETVDRPDPAVALSPRELEVLEMASHGLTNMQIAAKLFVSTHAIKFHLAGVYRKLGVRTRTELALLWQDGDRADIVAG